MVQIRTANLIESGLRPRRLPLLQSKRIQKLSTFNLPLFT